jgi:hypothetical protein
MEDCLSRLCGDLIIIQTSPESLGFRVPMGSFIHGLLGGPLPGVHDGVEIGVVAGVFIGFANEANLILDVALNGKVMLAVRARRSLRAAGIV